MKSSSLSIEKISRILWGLALLTIPVTSFRWFPFLGESRTLVRPLAMYPLGLLFPLLLFQAWRGAKKLTWAGAFVPLGAFVLFVIASSSLGLLIDPIPLYSQDYAGRTIRALITMLIGLVFFFSAVWMNKSEDDLRFSIKWLLAGLCLNMAWSGLQATAFYTGLLEKDMVTQWQLAFSMRQLDNTRRIAADVARRTRAGDLARADQHLADGAVAAAESGLVQAEAALAAARQQLRALAGRAPAATVTAGAAAEPDPGTASAETDAHPALQELRDRAAVAEGSAALAAAQSRASPELMLATTRDRGAFGESSQQTLTLGVRIPFGGGPRHDARSASARAEATEAQAQLALERERLGAEREAARVRVDASRTQLAAAERRAQLARESRGFFDKSFRLGETDLPTRLRIELEAVEAERQAARSRVERDAAISQLRQALGLLPE